MPEPAVTGVTADADLPDPLRHRAPRPSRWPSTESRAAMLAAVSAGGVLGALARHGMTEAFPHPPGSFGWVTFAINVSGSLLIGVVMVLDSELWAGRRLLRPFLGVGLLGGYTTFSAYVLDIQQAIAAGAARTGLLYLAATILGALAAVWAGATITGWAVGRLRNRSRRRR